MLRRHNTNTQAPPRTLTSTTSKRQHPHPSTRRVTLISLSLCLFLTITPPNPASYSSSTLTFLSPIPLCFAAPAPGPTQPIVIPVAHSENRELAFWTPITDAFHTAKEAISSIFHKNSPPPDISPAIGATTVTATEDIIPLEDDEETGAGVKGEGGGGSSASAGVRVVASVDDYGVAHLDLEGDPNCDYTAKVRIAGSEYNVIIDTGSAHFAVASNACKDCDIQRKDHFRPNEEEEIPIDADVGLVAAVAALGGSGSNSPTGALSGDQAPLNLLKGPVNKDREADSGSMTTSAATTTTTVTATASRSISSAVSEKSSTAISSVFVSSSPSLSAALSLSTLTSSHSAVSTEASSATATTHTPVTTSTSVAQRPSDLPVYPAGAAQDAFHVGANARFSDNLERLKKLQAEMASAAASEIQPIVPARHQSGDDGTHQRALVVAPEVHLYPLSANARNQGESIRVSYGIKTHSVGWSGVMTSDLMAIDMAKVKSGNSTTVSATAAKTTDAPGSVHLEDGGIMEKETNVGFAAITENTGFFSQECGAQHGIWGLGYRSLSVDRKPTLFDTLSASMKIPNGFALQLCGRVGNTTKSGNMFLGGYSTSHIAEPMQFVPLVKRDWYQVQLDGFKVMGKPVQGMANLNLPKTIVDSGTTNILMSHYNLQFLIDALSRSEVVQWSSLIPEQDINNFWFRNAVLRLPRSSFKVETRARAVEVVMSGVAVPIYTASFLRIKPVPAGQAPEGYVDFWWHGFASSTAPDSIEAERASGGAVMPGSVGTILGETLFSGKLVFFERGNEQTAQEAGDEDFGRIGFARGKNCFAPADHRNVDVLASQGQVAVVDLGGLGPVRVAATSDASGIRLGGGGGGGLDVHAAGAGGRSGGIDKGVGGKAQPKEGSSTEEEGMSIPIHISALDTHIRLMGGATGIPRPWSTSSNSLGLLRGTAAGIFVAYLAAAL